MTDRPGLPLVDPPANGEREGEDATGESEGGADVPSVAGVLLAAGTGSRFGDDNKLLARLDGEPIVRHAARTLVEAGIDPLVAVVGYEADRTAAALDGLPFTIVENDAYRAGQATSVRAGVRELEGDGDGDAVAAAVFALGDMPRVDPASVRALVDVYRSGAWTALAAAVDGERGNPVLFDRGHFDALADVSGDRGGRRILLSSDGSALVETGDSGVRRDVDTPADLDALD
ncbi:nucleotidyltransferase family protein [Salinigranum marinum]|uniref:nucleotidyltransferase family protein n=1 Tax=Salinigranum marinum TaxID=1515595 RepID=UPI002989A9F0|nr:nucleotidyltransferase family protein [Salinigranum marinum]